jgi:AraC-like DNA-binding protein
MKISRHIPKLPLNSYVEAILYVEGNNKGVGFPKTAMSLVFNLSDSFKLYSGRDFAEFIDYKKYWIAGLQTEPSYVESYGESRMIVIQFRILGAYAFLNQPLKDFTDKYVNLDCIFGNEAEETWEQLNDAETLNEKFLIAENFLYRKLLSKRIPNEKLISSIELLFKNDVNMSVESVCREHNISRKHLNSLFQEYLGVSPKMLSSLHRFQTILKTISKSKPEKLTDIAYELDFFDQAHFNNNFRRFTGLKPLEYLKNVEENPTLKIVPHFIPAK